VSWRSKRVSRLLSYVAWTHAQHTDPFTEYARRKTEEAEADRSCCSFFFDAETGLVLTPFPPAVGRAAAALAETQAAQVQRRQSPSPTHISSQYLRHQFGHQRRDSDTLRSVPHLQSAQSSSPTAIDALPSRLSPSARGFSATAAAPVPSRHRRSRTAPEPPTTSSMLAPAAPSNGIGKTWAAGDGKERDSEYEDMPPRAERAQAAPSAPVPTPNPAPPPAPMPAPANSYVPSGPVTEVRTRNLVVCLSVLCVSVVDAADARSVARR